MGGGLMSACMQECPLWYLSTLHVPNLMALFEAYHLREFVFSRLGSCITCVSLEQVGSKYLNSAITAVISLASNHQSKYIRSILLYGFISSPPPLHSLIVSVPIDPIRPYKNNLHSSKPSISSESIAPRMPLQ